MESLSRSVKKSVGWLLVGRGVKGAVNAVASVALARMLEPRTFGVFAIAGLFIGFTKQFQTMGMGKAAIRLRNVNPAHLTTLFTVNLASSSALCATMWVAAPLLERLFHEPDAVPVLRVLALGFLANPFSSLGITITERRLDYRSQTLANILFAVFKVATSLTLAWWGYGVWSLAIGQLVGQVTRSTTLAICAGWVPRLGYSREAARDLAGFGLGMFVKSACIYAQDRIDYFVVGKWLGATSLGFFERAYRIPEAIAKELGTSTSNVLFSAYSRIQEERERLGSAFVRVLTMSALLAFPGLVGISLIAPSFIHVVFGPKWDPAVAPLQILCVGGLFRMLSQAVSTLMNALGIIRAEAMSRVAVFILATLGLVYATRWGLIGIAGVILLVELLTAAVLVGVLVRVTHLRAAGLFRPQGPILAATALMVVGVLVFQRFTSPLLGLHSLATLAGSTGIGAAVYLLGLYLFRNEQVAEAVKQIFKDTRPLLQGVLR